MSDQARIKTPKVTLPSGGGALRGIGEPFKAQEFTGSAGFSIPLPIPAARGLEPGLTLEYGSGNGNGVFGLGFSVPIPSISRKTSTGIPHYDDRDSFLLSGAELIIAYKPDGNGGWTKEIQEWTSQEGIVWEITAYRPRVEGSYNRIEQWVATATREAHWRVITSNNVTHIYGNSDDSRISDPENPLHVFEWLIAESKDAHGNIIRYAYKPEDEQNIPATIYNTGRNKKTQRYLWQVSYGNYVERPVNSTTAGTESDNAVVQPVDSDATHFAYQLCFDYGQIDWQNPNAEWGEWACRPDPFSSYKAGFEIRTWRRCRGVFLRQYFTAENNGEPFISQAVLLDYELTHLSGISIAKRIRQCGYRLQTDSNPMMQESPALELHYQGFTPEAQVWKTLEADAPNYLGNHGFISVDLYGEGIDGLLWSDEAYTGYLRPLGKGKFSPPQSLPQFPNFKNFASETLTFTSVAGNDTLDLVVNEGPASGYFSARENGGWNEFTPFPQLPVDFSNPDKEWVDIEGSGKPAILLYDNGHLKTYPSEGKLGYGTAHYTKRPPLFPGTNDGGQAVALTYADMFGDGLPHRVRIQNGRLEAWPCLGHGKFGECVTFGNSPVFEAGLDTSRVHMIDTDGSGAIDVVYMMPGKMRLWINQNGNCFADPIDIQLPSAYGPLSQVTPGDFTGYGTASLLLTQVSPQVSHHYYDFAGGKKPYLLKESHNGMGGKTSIHYTTSVLEYLRDQKEGRDWPTRLPFPVHVTQKVMLTDEVTGTQYTQHYRYHDGYFDPIEREFRGFGFVESWDTERYEEFSASTTLPDQAAELLNKNLWVPPVHTKSWFLTGAYARMPEIMAAYQQEFFQGDAETWRIPEFVLGATLQGQDADTLQQAYAALGGHTIRTEVYAMDGNAAENPYTIAQSSVKVRLVQPRLAQRYCSVQVLDSQSLNYNYERNPTDPQIAQSLVLAYDEFGNPLLSATVNYPRRNVPGQVIYPEQQALHCVVSEHSFINSINLGTSPLDYWQLVGVDWQAKAYHIGGITAPENGPFSKVALAELVGQALQHPVQEHASAPKTPWSRLLSWSRSYYWNASQDGPLPGGEITPLALLRSSEAAILNEAMVTKIYGTKVDATLLQCESGYVLVDGYWWNPGLVQHYHREAEKFYLPYKTDNPVAAEAVSDGTCSNAGLDVKTSMIYDRYLLNIVETAAHLSDTIVLRTFAQIDYQALQPWQLTDANENVSEVLFDPLGKVVATTQYGTLNGKTVGDLPLSQYVYQPDATFDAVIANPATYLQGATQYFYYDFFAWKNKENPQPVNAIALQRMQHVHDDQGNTPDATLIQTAIVFSNGLGNTLQAKGRVGPGPVTMRKGDGTLLTPEAQTEADIVEDRWLVTGRVVYNNKGKPTEQYEPFFSAEPQYESQQDIIDQKLVPPPSITHYDPLGRVIKVTSPKGFFSKTLFTAWQSQAFDHNDTVLDSAYYQWFTATYPNPTEPWQKEEQAALDAAVRCYNTPSTVIVDNLGRAIRTIADNLGAVGQNAIPAAIAKPDTPADVWQSLVDNGYLVQDATHLTYAWVTAAFQPYLPGFSAQFQAQYPDNGRQLEEWLMQSCLTSIAVYDIQGNVLFSADPRLYAEMVREKTGAPATKTEDFAPHFNFGYIYDMAGTALYTHSVDAGKRWVLSNIYGSPIQTWDSRGFNVSTVYDRLQRPTQITVTGGDGSSPLNNTVEVFLYGETVDDAANYNLRGKLHQQYDQAGLTTVAMYGLGGQSLQFQQRIRPGYKQEVNWTGEAQQAVQEEPLFSFQAAYNAIGNQVMQTLPDGSILRNTYTVGGRLIQVDQEIADADVNLQEVMQILGYDANGQRTLVRYGNGVQSSFTYDALTQQLVQVQTTRSGENGTPEVFRYLQFTYDPVGNQISQLDQVSEVVYHDNQKVEPKCTYTYDPLYRLVASTGKTLPGLNTTRQGSDSIKALIGHRYAPISDLQNMENYTRQFAYDAGGNLILQRHIANSGNWTQVNVIAPGSNRLETQAFGNPSDHILQSGVLPYDANGNLLRLYPNSKATVAWNYRNNIANVTQIQRTVNGPNNTSITLNDAEYYVYNSGGARTRKVTERMQQGGAAVAVTDKLYFGGYEITLTYTRPAEEAKAFAEASAETTSVTLLSEKRSIHALEGATILTITDVWVKAPNTQKGPQTGDVQTRFLLHDGLGSVTMELTTTAELMSYEQYYPYGGTAFTLARSQLEADTKEYRFCGKECDAATGLYYYGARYYATWLCRWMSPDPAGTVDGPNLYAYVGGNPVGYNDPTGMGKRGTDEFKREDTENPLKKPKKSHFEQIDDALALAEKRKVKKPRTPRRKGEDKYAAERVAFPKSGGTFGRALSAHYLKFFPNKKNAAFNVYENPISVYWNATNPFLKGGPEDLQHYDNIIPKIFTGDKGENQIVAQQLLDRRYDLLETAGKHIAAAKLEIIVGIAEEYRKKGAVALFEGILKRVAAGKLEASKIVSEFHFTPRPGGAMKGRFQVATAQLMLAGAIGQEDLTDEFHEDFLDADYYSQDRADYTSEDESDHSERKAFNPADGYKIPKVLDAFLPDWKDDQVKAYQSKLPPSFTNFLSTLS